MISVQYGLGLREVSRYASRLSAALKLYAKEAGEAQEFSFCVPLDGGGRGDVTSILVQQETLSRL